MTQTGRQWQWQCSAVQCWLEEATTEAASVSTTSPLGPAVVMDVDRQRGAASCGARASRQADSRRTKTRTTHAHAHARSAETGGAEARETMAGARALTHNAGFGRARCVACACCYARKQPRLLGRRKGDDAVLGRAARRGTENEKEGVVSVGGTEKERRGCKRKTWYGVVSDCACVCVCACGFAAAARTGYGRRAASGRRHWPSNSRSLPSKSLRRKSE